MAKIEDLAGLPLYARQTVSILRYPAADAQVIRTISPGGMIGVIYSYLGTRPGRSSAYLVFNDASLPNGTGYVAFNSSGSPHLDMPRLKVTFDARAEEIRRRRLGPNGRALEDAGVVVRDVAETAGSNVLTGAMLLGGLYVIGRIITRK